MSGQPPWYTKRTSAQIAVSVLSGKIPSDKDHSIPGSEAFKHAIWELMKRCWARVESRPTASEIISEVRARPVDTAWIVSDVLPLS